MNSLLNTIRSNMLVQGIICALLGIFLMFWPNATVTTVVYLLGVLFALTGIVYLVSYFRKKSEDYHSAAVLATGVFFLIMALVVFLFPHAIASFASIVAGVVLTLAGVVSAIRSVELRELQGYSWIIMLVVSILVAIGGVVIIANPFTTTTVFVFVIGLILLVNGIADIVIEIQFRRMNKMEV